MAAIRHWITWMFIISLHLNLSSPFLGIFFSLSLDVPFNVSATRASSCCLFVTQNGPIRHLNETETFSALNANKWSFDLISFESQQSVTWINKIIKIQEENTNLKLIRVVKDVLARIKRQTKTTTNVLLICAQFCHLVECFAEVNLFRWESTIS